ncbi:M4 family metallopeptidase [Legionella quinlivanii]|uniref:M4 family metallopeptidase n=1 Tax=Legionella quinlivanii TaxID=45073 RepID=UPI0022430783|nr:M4 family metallopeptidase [Legionella quinlivanii]MCW8450404.1 M4 family metallopeptidase [Legionella quinlivanii]
MFKRLLVISSLSIPLGVSAAEVKNLYHAPLSSLGQFKLEKQFKNKRAVNAASPSIDELKIITESIEKKNTVSRYQQYYKGVPVIGGQAIVIGSNSSSVRMGQQAQVNGQLIEDIELDVQASISRSNALELAKKEYLGSNPGAEIQQEKIELQIRISDNNEPKLVYLTRFNTLNAEKQPAQPVYLIDAHRGNIISQWNNLKNYTDTGAGGNTKVQEYWYGKDGLPGLEVAQQGERCIMDDSVVRLVDLNSKWDWNNTNLRPFQYLCGDNQEESTNGAYGTRNDAYYFGHMIVDMYKNWYSVPALQQADGRPMTLIMRVHFGKSYDNAFWDGETMSFGDGDEFYPLVSLDIAGHEVTHGFTEQHAGLEYHDESGALNESMSDMAGQAARAYLLATYPQLYSRVYANNGEITWGIGETVVRDSYGKALRFMDNPSEDGSSADCLDRSVAMQNGASCRISYSELLASAQKQIPNPLERQSYLVHTASGIFNKAFFLLSQEIPIRDAYHLMIQANSHYWTANTDFTQAACGVIYAANDLGKDTNLVRAVMGQVGINTSVCGV